MHPVLVVGGGIAGLSAAYELQRAGVPYQLFEATDHLGGLIRTERAGEFIIDAGPDSLLILKPGAVTLCRDLGISDRLIPVTPPRTAYLYVAGRLRPYDSLAVLGIPASLRAILTSRVFSPAGKLRLLYGFLKRASARREESIADFIGTRLGPEAVRRIAEPLLAGIHAGRADRLSVDALFPMLKQAERAAGNLMRGVTARQKQSVPGGPFRSFADGMQVLSDALASTLSAESVVTGTPVAAIHHDGSWVATLQGGERIRASAVILATPTFRSADLVATLDRPLGDLLSEIRYVTSAVIALGYRERALKTPLAGTGFVVAPDPGVHITGATWVSAKWPGRAPPGHALIRAYLAEERTPGVLDRTDEDIVTLVREDLSRTMGLEEVPTLSRVFRWHHGNPQYDVGHLAWIQNIDTMVERHPGLYLTGSGLRGTGIPDCITDGREMAAQAARFAVAVAGTSR